MYVHTYIRQEAFVFCLPFVGSNSGMSVVRSLSGSLDISSNEGFADTVKTHTIKSSISATRSAATVRTTAITTRYVTEHRLPVKTYHRTLWIKLPFCFNYQKLSVRNVFIIYLDVWNYHWGNFKSLRWLTSNWQTSFLFNTQLSQHYTNNTVAQLH